MSPQIITPPASGPMPTGSKEDDYILQWALESIRWSQEEHEKTWCSDSLIYYQHFKNFVYLDIDPDDLHSNIGVGLAFPTVKIICAMLMAPWQSGDQIMDAVALQPIGMNSAPRLAAWVNDKIVNQIGGLFSTLEVTKESGIAFGRGVLKPVYAYVPPMSVLRRMARMLNVESLLPQPAMLGSALSYVQDPAKREQTFEYVDPFNWWYVGASRFKDCDFTVERGYHTKSRIYRGIQAGEFNPPKGYECGEGIGYDQYTQRRLNLDNSASGMIAANQPNTPMPHRIHEIQGWVETKQRKNGHPVYEQRLIQVQDEKWLLKNQKLATWNGKPGYIVFEPMPDPGGGRPMGFIEPMEQVLLTINDFLNIALDNGRKIIESPLLIDPQSVDDHDGLLIGAAEQNWVRNPTQSVAPLPMKDIPESFYRLTLMLTDLVHKITGVSDYTGLLGSSGEGITRTARGIEALQNMSTKRFAPLLSKIDRELYRPMAQWIHETAKQHFQGEASVPTPWDPASPFALITPEILDTNVSFRFNTKALDAATGRKRQEFIEMMGILGDLIQSGMLQTQGYQANAFELVRMALDEFDREQFADRIIEKMPMAPMSQGGPFATVGGGVPVPGAPLPPAGLPMPQAA